MTAIPRLYSIAAAVAPNKTSNVVIDGKQYNTATEPKHVLAQERANAKFNPRDVTYYLDGGKENTAKYEQIMTTLERDPLFNNDNFYDIEKEEVREQTMLRVAAIAGHVHHLPVHERPKFFSIASIVDPASSTRCVVHFNLFLATVLGSGTDAQFKYWCDQGAYALNKFFGCYAMTELGHGSNVAGMETTAEFVEETDEFIINTPHLGATKWWIGGAAHTATHSLVYARLIIKGKDYGVKQFVVPLRNVEDHSLKPGIALGDIGKKMGRDGVDNGWIQYTNVRIPRQFMLMRYAKVSRDGTVSEPPLAQLSYGALIGGRVMMVSDSYWSSKRFLTIAIRYAAARRQFGTKPGEPETRLLDYPYHQRRLMPRLAFSYALNAASTDLDALHYASTSKLASTDPSDKAGLTAAIDDLKELFSLSAGLKAFSTWAVSDIIDECRQACGGHGYSGYSGFGQGYDDWVVQCTWEGDNNILTLSAGRALIQSMITARAGKRVGAAVEYFTRAKEISAAKRNGKSLTDPSVILEAWEAAAIGALLSGTEAYESALKANGGNKGHAFETISQQRFECARLHTRLFTVRAFFNRVALAEPSIRPILTDVAVLFGLWSMEKDSGVFLQSGYLTNTDTREVTSLVDEYCSKVRDQAIPLTDAFNFSDFFINSTLGNYDGDVYTKYFEKVTLRSMNKTSKAPYYETVQRPYFHRVEDEKVDVTLLE